MRVQNNNVFATRPTKEKHEMPKYFLIYEGAATEPIYFNGIIVNRNKLAISENLTIISVLRSLEDLSNSHPNYALSMANEIIKNNQEYILKKDLLKNIKDYLITNKIENSNYLINQAEEYIYSYVEDIINYNDIQNIIIDIYKDDVFENLIYNIINYLDYQKYALDYNPDIDVINLIIDRDKGSFKEEQYDTLLKKCDENNIKLFVSNPCFEVWLLMHFDEFENLDFDKLLENKRVGTRKKSRKYSDKMLSDIIGYDKSNFDFNLFVDKVDNAIEREKNYCEDLVKLKDHIGSNVGILISNLKD